MILKGLWVPFPHTLQNFSTKQHTFSALSTEKYHLVLSTLSKLGISSAYWLQDFVQQESGPTIPCAYTRQTVYTTLFYC